MALRSRIPSLGSLALLAILIVVLVTGGGGEEESGGESAGGPTDDAGKSERAPVVDVVDGDTIKVEIGGEQEYVRYIGVDTPESVKPDSPVECFGPEASHFNQREVGGHSVRLVFDAERRDVYGRLLAYVYVGKRLINAELVERGYATTLTIAPNDSRAGLFDRLQREAAAAGRGLWSACET